MSVQRWLNFVTQIRQFGWEPTIYTADNPVYAVSDEALQNKVPVGVKVLKTKVPEPNNLFRRILFWKKDINNSIYRNQQQKSSKWSIVKTLLWWVRGNFFIPDARFLWIRPSINFLAEHLRREKYDLILSSGPPHSLHLIAKGLVKAFDLPWIADFRDPWTSMDYLQAIKLTSYARKRHWNLEASVIKGADQVVVVGRAMQEEYRKSHQVESKVIYNGYNPSKSFEGSVELDHKFTILHLGSFLPNRNCDDLWRVLSRRVEDNNELASKLEIKLVGKVAPNVLDSIKKEGLSPYLNHIDYVKHDEVFAILRSAHVLLLPIDRIPNAEFVVTGKIFEYLQARRPVLLLGPDYGDAAGIITDCKAGYCCNFEDENAIEKALGELFTSYLKADEKELGNRIEQYSSARQLKVYADLMNELVDQKRIKSND